ncbi:uncharacterized protein LOC17878922 [Capsella rubella]|nr:uncharacterized protein LOC17878922 [Capsella rubella]
MEKCYCCDKHLEDIFYYCSPCDFAMKIACVEKQPLLSVHHLKWHEHTLSLFPRHTSLTCDACALTHSTCHFYVCPPCDFVIHQSCISLPRVIRISRHPHRISFTPSFDQRDWFCSICRQKIDNRYGGYSCFNGSCSYAAHSRCATQSNVWDGIDLEGVPEEIEEENEPFVIISNGIIQHFSHGQHHLRLEDSVWGDYDESKLCQSCITPVYFGNFYSCMQCKFILHEKCANLSRKIYHPIHPHMLTLVGGYGNVQILKDCCSACQWICRGAFVYECKKQGCRSFRLNVQCATISEPLVYKGHMHPLFLTSKPLEGRKCSVCENYTMTFNCIECACDFALCFRCATIPQNVRYKHDEHMLTLSYGEETIKNWCEACEKSINPKKGFYKCDEYCCVTLHIKCLLGNELYINPGYSSYASNGEKVLVMPNNQHMSRPLCSHCKKRCLRKLVFKVSRFIFCCRNCVSDHMYLSL